MKFHLNHKTTISDIQIKHSNKLILFGSCFSESIGNLLNQHRFNTVINPNGIVFNPISISTSIINCLQKKEIDRSLILKKNGCFFSFNHHTSIYSNSETELLSKINNIQNNLLTYLKGANFLLITFGTAFVYKHKLNNSIVANCHKQPSNEFEKTLLSVNDITSDYLKLISQLKVLNPNIKILFTVSPVKYLKDGVEENSLSKATLLLAANTLAQQQNCSYFPAYELVSDDLRDYRFYKEDMAHPNNQAINYVWEKFSDTFFSDETKQLNKELLSIHHAENHKLLFPESDEAKMFQSNLTRKKEELKKKFPFLEI